MEEKKLFDTLDNLSNVLGCKPMIVGSWALKLHGIWVSKPDDVDLVILQSEIPDIKVLNLLQKINPIKYKCNYPNNSDITGRFDFIFDECKFNIWVVEKNERDFLWKNYYKIASVNSILAEKMKYKRIKDKLFILDFIKYLSNLI